jgi:hypothetical protein
VCRKALYLAMKNAAETEIYSEIKTFGFTILTDANARLVESSRKNAF